MEKARGGDRDAFNVLIRRYQDRAVLISQGVLRNWELSKDSTQNAFVKVYFGLKNFRRDAQFKTWFYRVVMNEAKDMLRRERSRGLFKFVVSEETEDGQTESVLELVSSPGESPREMLEALETKKKLERAIRQLPERERDVFVLRYFHELLLSEIAETLGVAVGTVNAHLAHGTAKLKTMLQFSDLETETTLHGGGIRHGG